MKLIVTHDLNTIQKDSLLIHIHIHSIDAHTYTSESTGEIIFYEIS